ncbi:MAG: hypothetical protein GY926_08910 [bacterium]|nr:hypothetical protein [bacterium]
MSTTSTGVPRTSRGGKKDSVRIISMPMYTGKMPGNLAEVLMLGWARMASKSSLLMRAHGTSIDGM